MATHNVVRVLGNKRRIYRGWERKDRIKLNEKELIGYVMVTRQSKQVKERTCYKGSCVEGYNWPWLAHRNSRIVKVANPPPVVEILTQAQILERVSKGVLTAEQAAALLEKKAA